jgi:plastocyanin
MSNRLPVVAGLVVGVAFIALFSLAFSSEKHISTVIIPEGSSQSTAERNNFEPAIIRVVIGVNNTVQWVNQDVLLHSVRADDQGDPDFFRMTQDVFLAPGETFEYTFIKPGRMDYHAEPPT